MHAVLRDFVNSAQGLFLMKSEKLIQRARAFANLIRLLDCLRNVRLRQDHSFAKLLPGCKLR